MFKNALFAIAPMMLLACSVQADDDLLSAIAKMDAGNDKIAQVESTNDQLGQADVDALLGDDEENSSDAIAACFRRFGGYGRSYGSYGHRSFGYRSYSSWHRPCYTSYSTYSHCYTPTFTYYTPSYSCYTPCYTSYWGCY
ncbi:hypothetical protein Pla22_14720 [Rubripirellula amarantea]|uniref:Uncharacterized protein n=1 Tax=Rubripirellula amarantea TaxID=2527999 RepID=A0A5C5WTG1_9BACT|nr:hypothetical protein [Rubripirellula amarantea]TWT53838.1 hypothetical protein Pla22_14720 [Rubripirellula amarantea]